MVCMIEGQTYDTQFDDGWRHSAQAISCQTGNNPYNIKTEDQGIISCNHHNNKFMTSLWNVFWLDVGELVLLTVSWNAAYVYKLWHNVTKTERKSK